MITVMQNHVLLQEILIVFYQALQFCQGLL
jgi:hypothetical protein